MPIHLDASIALCQTYAGKPCYRFIRKC